ncbi:hypothetical protein BHE74_00017866 [Ensete ventricosum]|uniref:U2A'/phosphoprotein 32 family A C-terminal domain-containing protein n=1 Tax=Ensete ventricosum TaxID=4639 RepID=A0A444ENL3_ENSVE|nr:hypothetical protein B296_00036472 [Ensete ventricosum]RWW11979.1 hypothetical protein GW17_00024376 [Ensete ventricosum]RWW74206.1 hypothetical protein BHE74_00017866 [Ensete ventricosum]RZR72719.1 hypothetical protein BHM03_00016092 [Ensete ventricosum]
MGCCNSKSGGDSSANRIARWRSTGIVALRDSKLRLLHTDRNRVIFLPQALPSEVLVVDSFVRTLDLTNNKINEVTQEISRLVNMQRLVLADNLIESLPTTIGVLRCLKVLILDGNRVTNLPDECNYLV